MNAETKIMREIENYLRDNRIWFLRVNADSSTVGVPDLIVCYEGKLVGLEVKTPSGKPTGLQLKVMEAIRESGGHGGFPTSLDEAVAILDQSV